MANHRSFRFIKFHICPDLSITAEDFGAFGIRPFIHFTSERKVKVKLFFIRKLLDGAWKLYVLNNYHLLKLNIYDNKSNSCKQV